MNLILLYFHERQAGFKIRITVLLLQTQKYFNAFYLYSMFKYKYIRKTSYEHIYLLVLLTPTDVIHRQHYFVCRLVCLW